MLQLQGKILFLLNYPWLNSSNKKQEQIQDFEKGETVLWPQFKEHEIRYYRRF